MVIEQQITGAIITGIKELYGADVAANQVQLQKTKKEFKGHLTLVVFPFLRMSKKSPEQTAQEIGEYLLRHEPAVAEFNVIKGFLNLTIACACWIDLLNEINGQPSYGIIPVTEQSPLVMIEYSSPNTNKPLHLGHVRNNLLGYSLSEIMKANGNKDEHRKRPRYPYLQVHARLAEMGQRRDSRNGRQERRPPDR